MKIIKHIDTTCSTRGKVNGNMIVSGTHWSNLNHGTAGQPLKLDFILRQSEPSQLSCIFNSFAVYGGAQDFDESKHYY